MITHIFKVTEKIAIKSISISTKKQLSESSVYWTEKNKEKHNTYQPYAYQETSIYHVKKRKASSSTHLLTEEAETSRIQKKKGSEYMQI